MASMSTEQAASLARFSACLQGSESECYLDYYPTPYEITSTLVVSNTNLRTIRGRGAPAEYPTLKRVTSLEVLMEVNVSAPPGQLLTISHLQFDGNRNSVPPPKWLSDAHRADLELNGTNIRVCDTAFIDARFNALNIWAPAYLQGHITIDYCWFDRAGDNGIRGQGDIVPVTIAHAYFEQNDGGAISMMLSNPAYPAHRSFIQQSTFVNNHRDVHTSGPGGAGGGQITLSENSSGFDITNNWFDGMMWTQPTGNTVDGMEIYGWRHFLSGNQSFDHSGSGLHMKGVTDVTVQGDRFEGNRGPGISVLNWSWLPETRGLAINGVTSINNGWYPYLPSAWGVALDSINWNGYGTIEVVSFSGNVIYGNHGRNPDGTYTGNVCTTSVTGLPGYPVCAW